MQMVFCNKKIEDELESTPRTVLQIRHEDHGVVIICQDRHNLIFLLHISPPEHSRTLLQCCFFWRGSAQDDPLLDDFIGQCMLSFSQALKSSLV